MERKNQEFSSYKEQYKVVFSIIHYLLNILKETKKLSAR